MNKSRLSLVISLAALLGGGLVLPNSASAHDRTPTFQVERGHHDRHYRHDHSDDKRAHHHASHWYLQRHREARYYDERPLKPRHKHGHKHAYEERRHHHREVQRVYQPAPVEHEYRRSSPLRLEIGYEIVL